MQPKTVLLFDGECNLCNGFVQFVLARDKQQVFQFASLQSVQGQALLRHYGVEAKLLSTLVLIHAGQSYTQSDAVLEIARLLSGLWPAAYPLRYLPRSLRNHLYQVVAQRRYRWFGRQQVCWLPTPALQQRFLS